jgi:ankyrin repeat protein
MMSVGAEVSICDYDRRTPLHVAASEGNLNVVRYLMKVWKKFQPLNAKGFTPLPPNPVSLKELTLLCVSDEIFLVCLLLKWS